MQRLIAAAFAVVLLFGTGQEIAACEHHTADTSAGHEHHEQDKPPCTCVGECSITSFAAAPIQPALAELAPTIVVASSPVAISFLPSPITHLLPFSTAPPSGHPMVTTL